MKSVTAAIMIKERRIFIAQRKSNDTLSRKWEFPGGKIELGETPKECLKREMKEEFEIEVSVGERVGESCYHYPDGPIRLIAFRAFWRKGEILLNAHENYRWVALEQLSDYDFAPADLPFVEKLVQGEIEIEF